MSREAAENVKIFYQRYTLKIPRECARELKSFYKKLPVGLLYTGNVYCIQVILYRIQVICVPYTGNISTVYR